MTSDGSLLFMAEKDKTTDIMYSLNQGLSWEGCSFSGLYDYFEFESLISVPINSKYFLVHSRKEAVKRYFIHKFDFENALPSRYCDDDDLELWSPQTPSSECVLGRKTQYIRRKATASCILREDYVPIFNSTNCECTRDDWACDYCFILSTNQQCVLDCVTHPQQPENCTGEFNVTTLGYRRIVNDSCSGGLVLPTVGKWDCSISTTAPDSATIPPSDSAPSSFERESSLSKGDIILIVVFTIVGFILLTLVVVIFIRHYIVKKRNSTYHEDSNMSVSYTHLTLPTKRIV
eukprot:TRINITY_DN615_c0_g1_i2.p1 TRINITY_DN615_c0_g1~~TRINITY_DN615_c0_g1_i2.p1  ORF type:complete len:322 (+),score=31.38 TRINITY_DN615_c0_g1_i2:99-968(+)